MSDDFYFQWSKSIKLVTGAAKKIKMTTPAGTTVPVCLFLFQVPGLKQQFGFGQEATDSNNTVNNNPLLSKQPDPKNCPKYHQVQDAKANPIYSGNNQIFHILTT